MDFASNINSFLLSAERRQLSRATIRLYTTVLNELEKGGGKEEIWSGVRRHIDNLRGKPGTINVKITIIKIFFNWLVKNRLCKENPTDGIELIKLRNGRTRFLAKDEISKLLEMCSPPMRVIVSIAVMTGLRRSAILGLKHAEIDLVNHRINVLSKGKAHSVAITDTLCHIIEMYRSNLVDQHPIYLFPNQRGTGPLDNNAMIEFRASCKRAGLSDICFHTLRHSFASILLKATGNIYLVQRALGHASIVTTQRYSHLMDDDLVDGLNKMDMGLLV